MLGFILEIQLKCHSWIFPDFSYWNTQEVYLVMSWQIPKIITKMDLKFHANIYFNFLSIKRIKKKKKKSR